jgi:outer membrane biosynthesis protein TonB
VGIVVAVALHAAIVAVTLFSWQHTLEIADQSPPIIPVDLVTVSDKTNIAPTVARLEPPQETPQPPPAPQDATPAPTPPSQAEAAPEHAPPQLTPKPAPPPKPQLKPAPPTPAPAPPKPKADDFNALLNKLTAPAASPRNARVADRTVKGVGDMNASTMDLQDALRNAIWPCWNPPAGAPNAAQLTVYFEIFLNPDGSVARPPQLAANSASAAAGDPYMRAAAEAARRAIYTCAPYKLPADKYSTWRDFTIDFNPSKIAQ